MLENIILTSMIAVILTLTVRSLAGDDALYFLRLIVLAVFFSAISAGAAALLVSIWAN